MKPTLALKPLVFALAAVMAVAAQADTRTGNSNNNNNNNDTVQQLLVNAGAAATVTDTQSNSGNASLNQGTRNDARMESSANGSQGNLGANTAGGSGNQQDNVAAIATADESFIFGSAVALSTATQLNSGNNVINHSASNNASLSNSANGSSGNIGVNVSAGDFNQQKNNLAIAVSGGRVAVAAAGASQTVQGLNVENRADRSQEVTTLSNASTSTGTYKGTSSGYVDAGYHKLPVQLKEQGTIDLAGSSSYQVLTPTGWRNPVTNTATLSNSLNGVSGNVGANVSAGSGNQQSNSLSIAAGCKACM
ncbi:heme utilization protein [Pseudomonas sp. RP23018S]|uniref:heme utilization protein n=1 Tax=Pseudomonas sp. RP23018S TaxID=3096037 RepID=UPI002ACA7FA2|nr:heme utilization protein [Pseudomonas sp. RP23018S]MDZ5605423.1 heme utilization protein [Pseudomonas sp. RP23018S]